MADRSRSRKRLALATMMAALFSCPATAVALGAEDPAFGAARESAEKPLTRSVKDVACGSQETYSGRQLHEGLSIKLQAGQESSLLVTPYANSDNE